MAFELMCTIVIFWSINIEIGTCFRTSHHKLTNFQHFTKFLNILVNCQIDRPGCELETDFEISNHSGRKS